jgi:uncharacterized membrane protein YgcG
MITKHIIPFYFFIALFIGLFIAYVSTPVPDIIIKYPTPNNAGKIVYKDDSNVCYKYKVDEVTCPSDKSKVKNMGDATDGDGGGGGSSNEGSSIGGGSSGGGGGGGGSENGDTLSTSVVKNMESFLTNLNNKYSLY